MNLLTRPTYIITDLMKYRPYQYSLIPDFIKICFEYANRFGLNYDISSMEMNITEDPDYHSNTHYAYDRLIIKLDKNDRQPFLDLNIPKLIDDTFFKLKGVYYIPMIYLLDEPITFKKFSISLYSLFKPITIDLKKNRVVINRHSIPVSRLFRIYLQSEQSVSDLCDLLNTSYIQEPISTTIHYVSKSLGCDKDINEIRKNIDLVFFDNWTKDLYQTYYQFNSMYDIIHEIENRVVNNIKSEFNDITKKRLLFIELILSPLFREFNNLANNLASGQRVIKLNIKPNVITDHFYSSGVTTSIIAKSKKIPGLSGKSYYSIVNGYSGNLSLKASFENPKSQSDLPSSVSDIHSSYKHRICPVSISNTNPGVISNLVPDQSIDLRYGIFK